MPQLKISICQPERGFRAGVRFGQLPPGIESSALDDCGVLRLSRRLAVPAGQVRVAQGQPAQVPGFAGLLGGPGAQDGGQPVLESKGVLELPRGPVPAAQLLQHPDVVFSDFRGRHRVASFQLLEQLRRPDRRPGRFLVPVLGLGQEAQVEVSPAQLGEPGRLGPRFEQPFPQDQAVLELLFGAGGVAGAAVQKPQVEAAVRQVVLVIEVLGVFPGQAGPHGLGVAEIGLGVLAPVGVDVEVTQILAKAGQGVLNFGAVRMSLGQLLLQGQGLPVSGLGLVRPVAGGAHKSQALVRQGASGAQVVIVRVGQAQPVRQRQGLAAQGFGLLQTPGVLELPGLFRQGEQFFNVGLEGGSRHGDVPQRRVRGPAAAGEAAPGSDPMHRRGSSPSPG